MLFHDIPNGMLAFNIGGYHQSPRSDDVIKVSQNAFADAVIQIIEQAGAIDKIILLTVCGRLADLV